MVAQPNGTWTATFDTEVCETGPAFASIRGHSPPCAEDIRFSIEANLANPEPSYRLNFWRIVCAMPFGLSDTQLNTVMVIAGDITPEKRSMFLERVGAMLAFRGRGHFTDADVADVASLASCGLVHQRIDAA